MGTGKSSQPTTGLPSPFPPPKVGAGVTGRERESEREIVDVMLTRMLMTSFKLGYFIIVQNVVVVVLLLLWGGNVGRMWRLRFL